MGTKFHINDGLSNCWQARQGKDRFGSKPPRSGAKAGRSGIGADAPLLRRPTNAKGMPLNGDCRRCPNNRAVGCGQLVIRFGVPEGKSEVSYLSQFHLLNATGRVYLNL